MRHWEYWPPWFFYLPVVAYILYLGIRHRHWTLFTAANPAIGAGSVFNGSRSDLLAGLSASGTVPPFIRVPQSQSIDDQLEAVRSFMADRRVDFPVACKPDRGRLGQGHHLVDTVEALRAYLVIARTDTIVQPDIPGKTFRVFYYRYPGQESGRIFAITEQRQFHVTGDGHNTLEHLILKDSIAVCRASLYLDELRNRLHEIPQKGIAVPLVLERNHHRGGIFLDGTKLITPALTQAFDDLARHLEGVHFGRYDVRTESTEAFMTGGDFKLMELNGLTWDPTHTRYPTNTLRNAWATLMQQWKIAFEIGAVNRKRGASTITVVEFLRLALTKDVGESVNREKSG